MTKLNKPSIWNKPQPQIIKLSKRRFPSNRRAWYCPTSAAEWLSLRRLPSGPYCHANHRFCSPGASWSYCLLLSHCVRFSLFNLGTWGHNPGGVLNLMFHPPNIKFNDVKWCPPQELQRTGQTWNHSTHSISQDLFVLRQRRWSELVQRAGSVTLNYLRSHPGDRI